VDYQDPLTSSFRSERRNFPDRKKNDRQFKYVPPDRSFDSIETIIISADRGISIE